MLALRAKPSTASPPKPLTIEFSHAQDKLLKFIRKHLHDPAQLFLGLPQGQGASLKSPPLCFDAKALLDKLVDPLCSHDARCFALRKAHLDLNTFLTPMLKLCVLPGLLCSPHSALGSDVCS